MTELQRGTLFVFLSAALYSIGGVCIKLIPWGGMSINGGRTAIALVVVGGYLVFAGRKLRLNRWILLGALCVSGTNSLFCIANKMTTAANAIVLQFTAPAFAILFQLLFFRKKPKKLDVLTCAAVFAGVACFFLEGLDARGSVGNLVALLSGVCYAGVFMLEELPDGDALSSVFWGGVLSAATGLPFLVGETEFSAVALVSLLVLGVFQVGVAYVLLCIGIRSVPSVTASLISGIEPILNPVLVALCFGEHMGPAALAGGALVVGAVVLYNILLSKQAGRDRSGTAV